MALSKTIKLDNGVDLNYHVIDTIEVIAPDTIRVLVHGFTSKEFYTKAMTRFNLIKEQEELVANFTKLSDKETLNKTELKKLDKLQTQINEISDKISTSPTYENCVLGEIIVEIPLVLNLSRKFIEKELLNTEQFKLAKIIS